LHLGVFKKHEERFHKKDCRLKPNDTVPLFIFFYRRGRVSRGWNNPGLSHALT
jgi:hypothetical protein